MPRIYVDLDGEAMSKLIADAWSERRSASRQAEVLLRRALHLPYPVPQPANKTESREAAAIEVQRVD